jgi:hypothetical protein
MIVALLQLGGTTQAFIITASLHLGLSIVVFESREINAQQDAPSAPSGLDISNLDAFPGNISAPSGPSNINESQVLSNSTSSAP